MSVELDFWEMLKWLTYFWNFIQIQKIFAKNRELLVQKFFFSAQLKFMLNLKLWDLAKILAQFASIF